MLHHKFDLNRQTNPALSTFWGIDFMLVEDCTVSSSTFEKRDRKCKSLQDNCIQAHDQLSCYKFYAYPYQFHDQAAHNNFYVYVFSWTSVSLSMLYLRWYTSEIQVILGTIYAYMEMIPTYRASLWLSNGIHIFAMRQL